MRSAPNSSAGLILANSTAIPSSNRRTTCAGVEPSVTGSPIAGRASTATAAPDCETSIRLATNTRPFASLSVVQGSRG